MAVAFSAAKAVAAEKATAKVKQPRYWTPEEHRLFMEAVQRYGWKDVKSIAQHVGTRTPTQVRTHAQKLFLRQQKEQTGLMQPTKNGRTDMPLAITNAAEANPAMGHPMQALQEAGYLVHGRIVSPEDVGVPMRRSRLYIVAVRQELQFDFAWPTAQENRASPLDIIGPAPPGAHTIGPPVGPRGQ